VFTFVFLLNFQTYLHAQVKKANAKGIAMVTVTYIQGQVEVKKSNDKEWTLAKLNMILHQEDRLRTRLLSNTEIKFEDGSIVKVGENTMIDIKELTLDRETLEQESSIKLWLGKIRARIEKLRQKNSRFNVITPTAIVGVRGTTFIVCVEEDKTTKALVEVGEIYFRGSSQLPEEEVTLKSSEFSISSTDGTKVTPPQKISPEEIEKIKEEVKEIKSLEIIENKEEPKDKDKEVSSPTKDPAKEETSPEVIETKKEDPETLKEEVVLQRVEQAQEESTKESSFIDKEESKEDKEESEVKITQLSMAPIVSEVNPPKLVFPQSGALVSKNYLNVKGISDSRNKITFTVIKGSIYNTSADQNGNWNINQVYLPEGECTINMVATNQDNLSSEVVSLNLLVDTYTLKPKIIFPSPDSILNSVITDISGNAEPNSSIALSINESQSLNTVSDDSGNFSFQGVALCKPTPVKINYYLSNQDKFVNYIPKLFLNLSAIPPNGVYNFKIIATDKVKNVSEPTISKVEVVVPMALSINDRELQLFGPLYNYTYEAPHWELGYNKIEITASYQEGIKRYVSVPTPYYDYLSPVILTKRKDLRNVAGKNYLVLTLNVFDEGSGIRKVMANDISMVKAEEGIYEWTCPGQIYQKDISAKIKIEDFAGNITTENLFYSWIQIKNEFNIDIPPLPEER